MKKQPSVRIGCGAGYQGDRVAPAAKLIKHGQLDYLFLECLAERTLAIAHERMRAGGVGYDPRLQQWFTALLPLLVEHQVKLITNMGAADPFGAGDAVSNLVRELGLPGLRVVCCGECREDQASEDGVTRYTYLGADTVLHALKEGADVVITGRVADPSMLVGAAAFAHGWSLTEPEYHDRLAKATMAGHLLECGFHLTGGYFAHPEGRDLEGGSLESLSDLSMPFADIDFDGQVILRKLESSRGELSERTCTQQLIYEIGDPKAYVTPDICADFSQVRFQALSAHAVEAAGAVASSGPPPTLLRLHARPAGFKMVMEASMGGRGAIKRAHWADHLVRLWMDEEKPGLSPRVLTYFLGWNSLYMLPPSSLEQPVPPGQTEPPEARVRWDGLFATRQDAHALASAVAGLALGGPAGIGGMFTVMQPSPNVAIEKHLVERSSVRWRSQSFGVVAPAIKLSVGQSDAAQTSNMGNPPCSVHHSSVDVNGGIPIVLYDICHSRAGDKGNTANVSVIPYDPAHFQSLKAVITDEWAAQVFRPLLDTQSGASSVDAKVYLLEGTCAFNIVLSPLLDGGVTVSRRVDIHGKSLSDLLLQQEVTFPRKCARLAATANSARPAAASEH